VSASEANGGLVFTISLSNASYQSITVDFASTDGSALAGSDYLAGSGLVTFAPGTTIQPIMIAVIDDNIFEPDETLVVDLTNPVNATIADAQGLGTIINDDSTPAISINDVAANEDTGSLVFAVSLSNPSYQAITVDFATTDGTALAGADYIATSGVVTFAPGEVSQPIVVATIVETIYESDETLFVDLTNPVNATIADSQGQGTITNDDGVPSLSITDATAIEPAGGPADFVFIISLSNLSAQSITVDFATADGTATVAGGDYVATSGTLTFAPGDSSYPVAVTVNDDALSESDETFFVNLSNPINANIMDGEGQGTIINDEAPAGFSIVDAAVAENAGSVLVTVMLNPASGNDETVAYTIADDTAIAGTDYAAVLAGTLYFPSGVTTQTIEITIIDDTELEGYEHFIITLSASSGPFLGDDTGYVAIIDDESPFVWEPACSFTDGRLNDDQRWDCAPPVAIYCTDTGVEIYLIDAETSRGSLYFTVTQDEIDALGVPAEGYTVIVEHPGVMLSRLATGELQINAWAYDPHWENNAKPYVITWDACPASYVTHHTQ
jgi:hypothetical protein